MPRAQDTRRAGQLPAEITGFVGRRAELTRLVKLLGGSRLVTVTGTGGVGKTRLALRAAAMAAGRYRDGVFLAELSDLAEPGLLGRTLAAALGLPGPGPGLDSVLDRVRGRSLLLILDTCEHLLDDCALLAATMLSQASGVTLLATSRQPLDAPGETVLPLAALPVPEDARGDAVELFGQRAAAAVPGFSVTDGNAGDVIRICRRLDGVPLAIELAAVRLRALSPRDLADRLDERFGVLDTARRGAGPGRHQTLHSAIAWSHDLCSAAEQAVWARLTVFAGSFDMESAEEVCAGGGLRPDEVTDALIGLVDKSVVTRCDTDGTRYRLLDAVREFGAARLAESGGTATARARHADRYFGLARDFQRTLATGDQAACLSRLRLDNANIRAALAYAFDGPAARGREAAARASLLYSYWQVCGLLGEGRDWLDRVLSLFPGPGPERARALIESACLGALQGNPSAVAEARDGTRVATDTGGGLLIARGYLAQNLALTIAGRYDEALTAGAEAERRLTALGARAGLLTLDVQMGLLFTCLGWFPEAVDRCQQGLARLGEADGERWLRSYFHVTSAVALYLRGGRQAECAAAVGTALPAKLEVGDIVGAAYALEVSAWLAADAGRGERAAWLLGAADALWRRTGSRLAGIRILEDARHRAEDRARAAVTGDRFDALFADGATRPLALIVSRAVADADTLDGPVPCASGPRPASPGAIGSRAAAVHVPAARGPGARAASGEPAHPALTPGKGRSPAWWAAACPTARSPRSWSSPCGPWTRTWTTSSASSASPPARTSRP